jgi:hypothetical protein
MKEYLQLLGSPQRDRVTKFTGVVSSICFDAYGCVMAFVTPPVGKDGKIPEGAWFDVKRLEANGKRVMPVPVFAGAAMLEVGAAPKAAPGWRP